jgi:hypothetical protein
MSSRIRHDVAFEQPEQRDRIRGRVGRQCRIVDGLLLADARAT